MYTYSKRLTAQLLLFSFLLESCYNPHIGMGKKAIPQVQEASGGNTYHAGKPYDKHREQLTSHIFTTADNHPVKFTYHNGQWQAAVKECASKGSWQHRQLPVVFGPGLAFEDLVDSNPTEQKKLLHICPDKDNIDHTSYVYVGITPSQAKHHTQLLSISAARQTAPSSQVGLAQPKKAATNTQQAQEQPGPQAVLALTNPWQQTGRDGQLPPTPARAASKPLPAPSSESLSQQFVLNKFISAQQMPRKRTHSFKQQNKLLHSQRAAQAKRQRAAAASDLPQPSTAIIPLLPLVTQPKSLAGKAPQGIADQVLLAQGGQHVRFMHHDGQWQATVREPIGMFSRVMTLPVACQRYGDVAKALADLQGKPDKYVQRRIHVLPAAPPYLAMVYIGEQGLKGGMDGAGEAPGDGEQEGASGSGPSQSAPQDREPTLRTLQARIAQGDSTAALVKDFNDAQTTQKRQVLVQCIGWFSKEAVETLTTADLQAYSALAHIQADTPANRELLASYFNSLCNKVKQGQYGEKPLIEALEYTLQNMDSQVFDGDPEPLIRLGNDLLDRLDPRKNALIKKAYPTYRSTLYALHQTLVLIKLIGVQGQLDSTKEQGLYRQFEAKIQALSDNTEHYPIVYHARLLEQSLKRLKEHEKLSGRILKRGFHFLQGAAYSGQVVLGAIQIGLEVDAIKEAYDHFKEALTRQGIKAEDWYDWHHTMNYASLLSLKDARKYKDVFEKELAVLLPALKDKKIKHQEGRQALRFGVVQQLRMLALDSPIDTVREASTKKLVELAQVKEWGGKTNVMEGLLDGLAEIAKHSQGAEKEQAKKALEKLNSSLEEPASFWERREAAAQKAITAWLGGQELAAKLRAIPARAAAPAAVGLFRVIHDALKEMANPAKVRQELKEYYQQPAFAQVKSLFEEEKPKHVDSLECQLMLIEQVKKKADGEGQQTDLSTHHERLEWVKNPIALEDLFKKRKTKPDGPEQEIQKVLLVGEPGTGKTTLSKKIAYHWAQEKWGKEFKAVYVLPVRALQESEYDDGSFRKEETLATAIANNCFSPMEEEEYRRFRDQINEELKQPTTLVVLDGLDERYGASEKLLEHAKKKEGRHKLLLLSRPYGIEQERTMVDIEIEHAGFNDGQMEAYVRGGLSAELGEELLQFIKAYPAIASIAHVPVNLQILCALWKDNRASVRKAAGNGSLPGLYRRLTEYTWERYARERQVQNKNCEDVFETLGKIALDALEKGEVLISQELVREHVQVSRVRDMLKDMKDAGFLLLQEVGRQYQFPHLTFQEYFAGRWLAKQLLSDNDEDQEEVQDFFTEHQYEPQYGQMLSFFSGEVSKGQKKKGIKGIRQVLSLLQAAPQEVVGVQHVLLQMRLLNEWLCVSGKKRQEGLDSLEVEFPVRASLEEWIREGLDRVRRGDDKSSDDRRLLSLLTRGLQGSRAVAAHAPALLQPLLEALRDQNGDVRRAASSALGKVVEAAPDKAEKVLQHLLEALKNDPSRYVRRAASYALGKVVEAAPDAGRESPPAPSRGLARSE